MCGRFTLRTSPALFANVLPAEIDPAFEFAPSDDVRPTQSIAAIRYAAGAAMPQLTRLRWGLIPSWAKDPKIASSLINARADSVASKPAFRSAFRRRRALVPADGFYEWQAAATPRGKKQPYLFTLREGDLFLFAALAETWRDLQGTTWETCTLITTEANAVVQPVHHRMPVILDLAAARTWLDPRLDDVPTLQALLRPYPAEEMLSRAVAGPGRLSEVEQSPAPVPAPDLAPAGSDPATPDGGRDRRAEGKPLQRTLFS